MFSLRTLFLLVAIAATICAMLARPSAWAAVAAPVLFAAIVGGSVFGALSTDGDRRAVRTTFAIILLAYVGMATLSIGTVGRTMGPYNDEDPWTCLIGRPAWILLHGPAPYSNTVINGYGVAELAGLVVTLHLSAGLITAGLGAISCHWLLGWSRRKAVKRPAGEQRQETAP